MCIHSETRTWHKNIKSLAIKAELNVKQDKIIKLQLFDSSYFRGKSHFEDDGTQNYLVFQSMNRYFKKIVNTDHISSWKSKGWSDEIIKPPITSDNSLAPALDYFDSKVKFDESWSKQDQITFTHEKTVNIYVAHETNL